MATLRNNSWRRLVRVFSQQRSSNMATEARETVSLIGSGKVEGTAVHRADDTKIGAIEGVMIDKMSGIVSYSFLSFGRFHLLHSRRLVRAVEPLLPGLKSSRRFRVDPA